jgi:hypothetical protein
VKRLSGVLKATRGFRIHLAIYLVVNALLAAVSISSDAGYFWPGWVIAGWGAEMALYGWSVFIRKPISEADVRREMERVN